MTRYLTEKEAWKVRCPRIEDIYLSKPTDDVREAVNAAGGIGGWGNLIACRGPNCMLWRHEISLDALGNQTGIGGRGYCSRYGKDD